MDYFWRNKGFVHDPNKNYFLSQYHLIMLSSMLVLGVLLWLLIKNLKQPKQRLMFKIIAATLLVLEVLRYLNFLTVYNHYNWFGALSFHLCSFGVYLTILAAYFQKQQLFNILVVFAIIGAPIAVIVPDGILPWFNEYSFMPMQSFISHMFITWVLIVAQRLKMWKPNYRVYYTSVITILVSFVIAHYASIINIKYQTGGHQNFIWTQYVEQSIPFVNTWSYPYYLIAIIIGLLLAGFIYTWVFTKKEKKVL